ncbi:hypothetical protein K9N68_14585 [Kovacikia minuta CCNUW1]|nr:hypothetical protein [Kovacikia minuta]UBF28953.1 hypothetical protein K9N68_14585 [Kovacikia minuta CCNUW1]
MKELTKGILSNDGMVVELEDAEIRQLEQVFFVATELYHPTLNYFAR